MTNICYPKSMLIWLKATFAMVFAMIIIGAITRLTDSGLSMVEWRLIYGFLPPLSEAEWQRIFDLYKTIPEYQQQNFGMSLEDFKGIFFWEYFHRLWGRLIGLLYALPLFYFFMRGWVPPRKKPVLFLLLLLGGLQGGIGWWMVKSGFVNRLDVSALRLMTHLGLALVILLILWREILINKMYLINVSRETIEQKSLRYVYFCFVLVFVAVLSGALVAGNDAGLIYNDWPLMGGQFIPEDYLGIKLYAWFHDQATVQFHHRMLAYIVFMAICGLYFWVRQTKVVQLRKAYNMLLAAMVLQVVLGVVTVMTVAHTHLAIVHHINALILLLTMSRFVLLYRAKA